MGSDTEGYVIHKGPGDTGVVHVNQASLPHFPVEKHCISLQLVGNVLLKFMNCIYAIAVVLEH